jgi:hypothetical protein
MTRYSLLATAFLGLSLATSVSTAQSQAPRPPVGGITFEQVIRLSQAGLSDHVIIAQIKMRTQPFNLSPDELLQLKDVHVSDQVIEAMTGTEPTRDTTPVDRALPAQPSTTNPTRPAQGFAHQPSAPAHSANEPRVYLSSASKGSQWNAARNQSMEMSKDIEKDCPGVRITISESVADYSILLNHIEHGFVRDNQIQIANKVGDLISRTKEGGSIRGDVKKACEIILADWAKH